MNGRLVNIFSLFFLLQHSVQGMDLYTYDVDSLVYMSPEICEAKYVSRKYEAGNDVVYCHVSRIHKGSIEPGATVPVTELNLYGKMSRDFSRQEVLGPGDELILFLQPTEKNYYRIFRSGVRLVIGEKALSFSQWMNPGPYETLIDGVETNTAIPTLAASRKEIQESIIKVEKWRLLLDREPRQSDIPQLLRMLEERKPPRTWSRIDLVTDKICAQLSKLHDVPALAEAVRVSKEFSVIHLLSPGFGAPEGREFLLAQVTDSHQPEEQRLKWATILGGLRRNYAAVTFSTNQYADGGDRQTSTSNGNYLKRIAQVAADSATPEKIQLRLLKGLEYLFPEPAEKDSSVLEDAKEARAILEQFYEIGGTEQVKFSLEVVMHSRNFKEPAPARPDVISILRPLGPRYPQTPGKFGFDYEARVFREAPRKTRVAFVNLRSGEKWRVPFLQTELSGCGRYGDTCMVDLPKNLPQGRYWVYLEYYEKETAVGEGHFMEVEF
jgi:hypothetical protein